MKRETIKIGRRTYRKFIPFPGPVTDGTSRCVFCGQIDEPAYHDDTLCSATDVAALSRQPSEEKAR